MVVGSSYEKLSNEKASARIKLLVEFKRKVCERSRMIYFGVKGIRFVTDLFSSCESIRKARKAALKLCECRQPSNKLLSSIERVLQLPNLSNDRESYRRARDNSNTLKSSFAKKANVKRSRRNLPKALSHVENIISFQFAKQHQQKKAAESILNEKSYFPLVYCYCFE